jgi:hypothetical protein
MVITMTNRLLAIVMAFALSSGIIAHAAQDSNHKQPVLPTPLQHLILGEQATSAGQPGASSTPAISLPAPAVLQAVANNVADAAAGAIDQRAPIRAAYVRDQVALEHLRQSESKLSSGTRQSFNAQISDNEAKLVDIERTALASSKPSTSSVAEMDKLVASAKATLARGEAQREGDGSQHSGSDSHSSDTHSSDTHSSTAHSGDTHSSTTHSGD